MCVRVCVIKVPRDLSMNTGNQEAFKISLGQSSGKFPLALALALKLTLF